MKIHPFIVPLLLLTITLNASCLVSIDIGHSKKRSGAISATGIGEYQYNKRAAIDLFYALEKRGIESFFVNPKEEEISLKERVVRSARGNADLFVSMHHDSVKEKYLKKWKYNNKNHVYCDNFKGYGLFISHKNKYFKESLRVASDIGKYLRAKHFSPTLHHTEKIKGENKKMYDREKGIYRYDNLVVLKYAKSPALLIENGVILNRNELDDLDNSTYRQRFIDGIVSGISSWCDKK